MNKIFYFLLFSVLTTCSNANDFSGELVNQCEIAFSNLAPCELGEVKVQIESKRMAENEYALELLTVHHQGKRHSLRIFNDVSLLDGDLGFIRIEDINFDGYPDVALTTSFGLANLYLDYWVYDAGGKKYIYIGNLSRLTLDPKTKTVSNNTKLNAATYEKKSFKWLDHQLVEQP